MLAWLFFFFSIFFPEQPGDVLAAPLKVGNM